MQRKALILILLAFFGLSVAPAYAENSSESNPGDQKLLIEKRDAMKSEMIRDMKEKRDQMKLDIQKERETFKQEMEAKRTEMKTQMQSEKEAFRAKISAMKDERKKVSAERIDAKLASANKTQTDNMSTALTRLQEILNKLIDKTNEQKAAGKDIAATETAINNAKTAITDAQSAVAAQAAKTYTANVTDEAALKQNFKTVFGQLRTDLQTTHAKVQAAKKAVRQVAVELMKLKVSATISVAPTQ